MYAIFLKGQSKKEADLAAGFSRSITVSCLRLPLTLKAVYSD